jgi:DNA-directed RNA polymerase subunit H (RpoH/RPB5)
MEYPRIQKTMIEMMIDRGFDVVKFHSPGCNLINPMLKVQKANEEYIWVYITDTPKIGKKEISNFIETILAKETTQTYTHTILITRNELTSQAKKVISELKEHIFEVFLYEETIFNRMKHFLQPKFRIVTPEQVKEMCKKFKISIADFPKLSTNDIVSRYLGTKPRDVIEFTRPNGIYYRVVV